MRNRIRVLYPAADFFVTQRDDKRNARSLQSVSRRAPARRAAAKHLTGRQATHSENERDARKSSGFRGFRRTVVIFCGRRSPARLRCLMAAIDLRGMRRKSRRAPRYADARARGNGHSSAPESLGKPCYPAAFSCYPFGPRPPTQRRTPRPRAACGSVPASPPGGLPPARPGSPSSRSSCPGSDGKCRSAAGRRGPAPGPQ